MKKQNNNRIQLLFYKNLEPMYNYFLLVIFTFCNLVIFAQEKQDTTSKEHHKKQQTAVQHATKDSIPNKTWKIQGTNSISGNQSAFSNWVTGGTNNLTLNIRLNYDFNYKKDLWVLDNKLIASYGFNKNKFTSLKKTEDKIELNSILARNMKKDWNYSFFFNFKSQFGKGLDPKDPQKKTSHFLSPIFLMAGPGVYWRKNDNLKINFSPASPRFVFVHSEFTKMGKSYGVSQNEVKRFEFGSTLYAYYKLDIMKNVSMENILGVFADYIHDIEKVDFEYQTSIYFKVNKFIAANVYYDVLYDYDTSSKAQQKETVGIGFKYSF